MLHERYEAVDNGIKTAGKMLLDGDDPTEEVFFGINPKGKKLNKVQLIKKLTPAMETFATDNGFEWYNTTLKGLKDHDKIAGDKDFKLGAEMLGFILDGVTDFKSAGAEWKETVYKASITNSLDNLCKIDSPPGPNPHLEGNWLYTGATATKTASDKLWKIEKAWRLSDAGAKWNKTLYSKKDSGM